MKANLSALAGFSAIMTVCLAGCPSPQPPAGIGGTVSTPVLSPAAGTYDSNQSVEISCSTDGAVIHYTIDGSVPTAGSPVYSSEITINGPLAMRMIKALAVKSGMTDSAVGQAYYTVEYACASSTPIAGGSLSSNQTWSLSGSPYLIQGDLTVPAGITLTIEPGTIIQFAGVDGQNAGLDAGRVELTVRGTLAVNGNNANPVIFRANAGTTPDIWFGIVVDTPTASITGAIIKHAAFGIRTLGTSSDVHVADCISQTCGYGLLLAGNLSINAVTILDCSMHGIGAAGCPNGSITNAVIRNGAYSGIYINASSSSASLSVINCTIIGNADSGIGATASAGASLTANVLNCIITENSQYGVALIPGVGPATVNVTYSNVRDNVVADYSNVTAGSGCTSQDPLYVDESTDLSLQTGSPCIDAGSNTGAPAQDRNNVSRPRNGGHGEIVDMGAYER